MKFCYQKYETVTSNDCLSSMKRANDSHWNRFMSNNRVLYLEKERKIKRAIGNNKHSGFEYVNSTQECPFTFLFILPLLLS